MLTNGGYQAINQPLEVTKQLLVTLVCCAERISFVSWLSSEEHTVEWQWSDKITCKLVIHAVRHSVIIYTIYISCGIWQVWVQMYRCLPMHIMTQLGQDRFQTMCRNYYQDANGCFVMFDITNEESLDNCKKWKKELDNKVLQPNGDPIPSILLANKVLYHQYCSIHLFILSSSLVWSGW